MKNKNIKLLTILSAGALVMGLASCGENTNSSAASEGTSETSSEVQSSETPSSSSITKTPKRIKNNGVDTVVSGVAFDLDDTITILYDDDSSDHNYTVTSSSDDVSISGHLITIKGHGEYSLLVTAGTLKSRVSVTVVSEEHKALIDFLEPLSETPQNYTITQYEINKEKELEYYATYFHNENYIAIYDENDPVAEDGSTLLAKLTDGHAYWGTLTGTSDNIVPTFEPGYASWNNYYITGDLSLDALDATYDGDVITLGTGFEGNLLHYGMSTLPENYGYNLTGAIYLGMFDTDDDEKDDTPLFMCNVESSTDSSKAGYWSIVGISNIGSTSLDFMEKAVSDAKYIPVKIEAPEISTVFNSLAESKNYTITTELQAVDAKGQALEKLSNKDCLLNIGGSSHIIITTTFTKDGVISVYKALKMAETTDEDYPYAPGEEWVTGGEFAYWDDGTNTYSSSLDSDTGKMGEKTTVAEGKTVYESGALDNIVASNVTLDDANGTIWSKKTQSGTKATFEGDVGDNDGSDVTNSLFGKIFDMNGFGFNIISTQSAGLGTNMVTSVEFNGGDYHALTIYSSYNEFTVDTATNDVLVDVLAYLPVGTVDYISMKLTVSNVGTTTNDFTFGASSGTEAE